MSLVMSVVQSASAAIVSGLVCWELATSRARSLMHLREAIHADAYEGRIDRLEGEIADLTRELSAINLPDHLTRTNDHRR